MERTTREVRDRRSVWVRGGVAAAVTAIALVGAAAPVGAKAKPGCKTISASTINKTLGTEVAKPTKQASRTVTVCIYAAAPGSTDQVLIRYETRTDSAAFEQVRDDFDDSAQPTTDLPGLGSEAFTSSLGGANTVVFLDGSTQVLVTGTAPLDRIEALSRKVLKKV